MMKKTLILVGNNVSLFTTNKTNVLFSDIYDRNLNTFIVKICRNFSFLSTFCIGSIKKSIKDFSTIIVFDSEATVPILKWIQNNSNRDTRLILYYRNSIASQRKSINPKNLTKFRYELWTYNLHDSKKYHMKYNKQVLDLSVYNRVTANNSDLISPIYDVVFLGYSKDREKILRKLYFELDKEGLNCYFYIPDIIDFPGNKCVDGKALSYDSYLKIVAQSKAVIDIVVKNNYGLTLRPLESIIFEKKLITNYRAITEYDFYSKNNVMIFDESGMENIKEFLNSDYKSIPKEIVQSFGIEKWIDRFSEEI